MKHLLTTFLKEISSTTMQGDAREESYYPALAALFEGIPQEKGKKINVTILPKSTEAGNPDFRVWDGAHKIVGYIEAKVPGTNLDHIEVSEQLTRYRTTFPNLILTDFFEFRLYRNGELIDKVSIGRHFIAKKIKTTPPLEHIEEYEQLAERFFSFSLPKVFTAEELAIELAKRTRFLRDQVVCEELKEAESGKGDILGFYHAFKEYLISSLTPEQFADLYSQTITYGLFAARTRADGEFNRKLAFDYIPHTIGILRDVFRFISLGTPSSQMEVIVDDISEVLNVADINNILGQYYKEGKGEDPIVHFYETFLNQYDPQTRERRGVYYTPEPVVKYIVKSVHQLLKSEFGLRDGLADPGVTILDPAAGTLTFPAEAIKVAVQEYVEKYGEGGKKDFIRNQILKNFYALELMMAPYAIGHMKISFLLDALGCPLREDERFQLYLTNTLEMEEINQINIPGIGSLSEESRLAGKVKKQEPILVIMGNPPYSGISYNKNEWTEKLLKEDLDGAQSYYKVDGHPLGERNPKWLQDDYVKFLRFAQWKIQKAGKGIVAMITSHGYIDNPTFKGMRQSLIKTFDKIYILDLHGDSQKKETAPDGSKDENVFDIRKGVAIALFIKGEPNSNVCIKHEDLFGLRKEKYEWLNTQNLNLDNYSIIEPKTPNYFLIPQDTKEIEYYQNWIKLTDLFPTNSVGIVTSRDNLVILEDKRSLFNNISQFVNSDISDEVLLNTYNLKENSNWKINKARKELKKSGDINSNIYKMAYRPFDERFIYYHPALIERIRDDVMRHMISGSNIGLISARSNKSDRMDHFFVADKLMETKCGERTTQSSLFPLYLYPDKVNPDLFSSVKKPNLSEFIYKKLLEIYNKPIDPREILNYVYSVFYSHYYREKYFDFIRIDFPRIPFPSDYELFIEMEKLGSQLVDLHLLQSYLLNHPSVKYQGHGDDHTITRPEYSPTEKRVYINSSHYFEGVEPDVWEYQIGGYQVMNKYLKDRKGRKMDDPRHYIHIATALQKTIEIQEEIDAIYPEVEKDVIDF
jgi:hypothetical protein